ncbi:MAG: MFS transporter [Clostridia bacterium]|nr:MFS transporter [Clostridia bacterium]
MKVKLNYRRTFFAGMAFFLICMFWQAYDNTIPLVLTYKFKMSQTLSGGIMAIDNILALFMLPLFGRLSDKCNTKLGRRTPFILVGTIIAVALFALLPFIDSLLYFVITLVAMLIAMAVFRSPAVALMPDITVKPLRSKANAVINLMGTIGGIIALLLGIVFATKEIKNMDDAYMHSNYYYYFISVASAMLISLVIYMLFVRENRLARDMQEQSRALGLDEEITSYDSGDEEAGSAAQAAGDRKLTKGELCSLLFLLASIFMWYMGYNAVTSKYSVYAADILHKDHNLTLMIAQAAGVVSFLPVGIIASKRGRKKTILAGVIMMVIAFGSMTFVTAETPMMVMNILFAIAGIGWASINVNSFPMVVELCTGSNTGLYTGYYYTASMAAQIVTPIFSGWLMDMLGLKILCPYAALFSAIAFFTMLPVRHGDILESRLEQAAQEAAAREGKAVESGDTSDSVGV